MNGRIKCQGCCWITKDDAVVYRCDQEECPFWKHFFERKQPKVETCFT